MPSLAQRDRHDERRRHRRHLGPGVDAPPVPAEDVDEPRARAQHQQQLPRLADLVHVVGRDQRQDHGEGDGDAGRHDVVALAGVALDEAAVEVVGQVARAPVHLRGHRRHVGGGERGQHQPAQPGRQDVHHDADVAEAGVLHARGVLDRAAVHGERAQRGDHPRPAAHRVVRDVEEEDGVPAVALGLAGEHVLRDVAAAARLRARIPGRPPVDGEQRGQGDHGHGPDRVRGPEGQHRVRASEGGAGRRSRGVRRAELRLHRVHPAHRVQGDHGEQDRAAHLEAGTAWRRWRRRPRSRRRRCTRT